MLPHSTVCYRQTICWQKSQSMQQTSLLSYFKKLLQPPSWLINHHQRWGKTLYQQKGSAKSQQKDWLKSQMMVSIFQEWSIFKVCELFFNTQSYHILDRQYSVNLTFICTGKLKHPRDLLCGDGLELNPWYLFGMPVIWLDVNPKSQAFQQYTLIQC